MLSSFKDCVAEKWKLLPIPVTSPSSGSLKIMPNRQSNSDSSIPRIQSLLGIPVVSAENADDKSPVWSLPAKYKPSEFAKSRELGRIDPNLYMNEKNEDLYDVPLGHLGRVWFTLSYDVTGERLRVTLHKARNLRAPTYRSFNFSAVLPTNSDLAQLSIFTPASTQDCRIRVFIESIEKKFHTTSIKKATNNPTFEETFSFQIPQHHLQNHAIRLEVLSVEKTKRSRLVGLISFPLNVLSNVDSQWKPMRFARDLQVCDYANIPGNIVLMVSLTYFLSTERITVGIFECQNLPLKSNGLPINVYAKVIIFQGIQSKWLKTKRTELLEQRESFNESFTFSRLGDLTTTNIRVVLLQPGFFDKPIAFLVLGNGMVSKGSGIKHWNAMLEHPEVNITEYHEMQSV